MIPITITINTESNARISQLESIIREHKLTGHTDDCPVSLTRKLTVRVRPEVLGEVVYDFMAARWQATVGVDDGVPEAPPVVDEDEEPTVDYTVTIDCQVSYKTIDFHVKATSLDEAIEKARSEAEDLPINTWPVEEAEFNVEHWEGSNVTSA